MTSRRQFIQVGAAVGVGSLIRWQIDSKGSSLFQAARALAASGQTALLGSRVPQFVTPLPTFNGRRVALRGPSMAPRRSSYACLLCSLESPCVLAEPGENTPGTVTITSQRTGGA